MKKINKADVSLQIEIKDISDCVRYNVKICLNDNVSEEKIEIGHIRMSSFDNRKSLNSTINDLVEIHSSNSDLQYDILETILNNKKYKYKYLNRLYNKHYLIIEHIRIEQEYYDCFDSILAQVELILEDYMYFFNIPDLYINLDPGTNAKIKELIKKYEVETIEDNVTDRVIYYKNTLIH